MPLPHAARLPLTATALGALLTLPALQALATTPDELLAEWRETASTQGQTLTFAGRSQDGDTLVLRDLALSIKFPEGKIRAVSPETRLTGLADGTVDIAFGRDIVVRIDNTGDGESVGFLVSHEGLALIAGGTPETRSYDYDADRMTMVLDALDVRDAPDTLPEVSLTANGISSRYVFDAAGGTARSVSSVDAIEMLLRGTDDETAFDLSYQVSGLESESLGPSGVYAQMDDPAVLFESSVASLAEITHGGSAYSMTVTEPGETVQIDGSTTGGLLSVGIGPGGLTYSMRVLGQDLRALVPDLPFPLETSADALGFDLTMPMTASDVPGDARLRVEATALTVSNGVWNMFDPGEILPRDPATLLLDLSGKLRLFADLYDEQAMGNDVPGEFTEVSIDALTLSALGAELTGSGTFTVDNGATGFIPDAPKLVGVLDLALSGADALLQNLTAIGILTPEDVMGARMMMGMMARPGPTPDSLVSKIELTPQGGLIANGLQLQ